MKMRLRSRRPTSNADDEPEPVTTPPLTSTGRVYIIHATLLMSRVSLFNFDARISKPQA